MRVAGMPVARMRVAGMPVAGTPVAQMRDTTQTGSGSCTGGGRPGSCSGKVLSGGSMGLGLPGSAGGGATGGTGSVAGLGMAASFQPTVLPNSGRAAVRQSSEWLPQRVAATAMAATAISPSSPPTKNGDTGMPVSVVCCWPEKIGRVTACSALRLHYQLLPAE